jgi:uncharacterized protein involved in tellurium resistance
MNISTLKKKKKTLHMSLSKKKDEKQNNINLNFSAGELNVILIKFQEIIKHRNFRDDHLFFLAYHGDGFSTSKPKTTLRVHSMTIV